MDARLSIYEHQSTVCPNMPVRSLIYFSVILSDMLSDKKKEQKGQEHLWQETGKDTDTIFRCVL